VDNSLERHPIASYGAKGIRFSDTKSESVTPDSPSATIFSDALRELGLQLVPGRANVEYVIVDHAEKPSEN
jgi:uncharacterized protein (TIGR03435 family)